MIALLYRWLPRIFYCHCRPDRSFFWRGRQFPLCARCTGQLAGMLLGIVLFVAAPFSVEICVFLMLALIADGFLQLLTRYESTNLRRLLTGILFGVGFYELAAWSVIQTVTWGHELGKIMRENWMVGWMG